MRTATLGDAPLPTSGAGDEDAVAEALDGALQALTEYGSALAGSGRGGLADRVGRTFDLIGQEVGEVVAFALAHPAPTALGLAVLVVLAVLWAINLR